MMINAKKFRVIKSRALPFFMEAIGLVFFYFFEILLSLQGRKKNTQQNQKNTKQFTKSLPFT
jgi:hypothetical protein